MKNVKTLEKGDVVGILEGRKGRKTKEGFTLHIKACILDIPLSENMDVMDRTLYLDWGNESHNYKPGYKFVRMYLLPNESGSVLEQAKEIVEDAKQKLEKGLNCKVYNQKEIHI